MFSRLDQAITDAGYLPISGQITDATLKFAKAQPVPDGTERFHIAIPTFGYKRLIFWRSAALPYVSAYRGRREPGSA